MVVVHGLDEGLDAGALGDLLLGHGLGDLKRIAVDTSKDGVRVLSLLGAFIEVLDDDSLSAGVSALENDNNLSRFQTNGRSVSYRWKDLVGARKDSQFRHANRETAKKKGGLVREGWRSIPQNFGEHQRNPYLTNEYNFMYYSIYYYHNLAWCR